MMKQIFIITVICLTLVYGINCSNTLPRPPKPQPEKPSNIEKIPEPKPASVTPIVQEETIRLSMDTPLETIYQDIIKKISTDNYSRAMEEIEFIIDHYNSPQPYVIESQLLRLVLLTANRAAYLNLAAGYSRGWETVLKMSDKALPSEERIKRLATLSDNCVSYYKKHKEASAQLLRAHDNFSQIPSDLLETRLRVIALYFKQSGSRGNAPLGKAMSGISITTGEVSEAEAAEIHNQVRFFLSGLSGKGYRKTVKIKQLSAENSFVLNKKGFYTWLADVLRYKVKETPPEAFGDKPELREILLRKAEETSQIAAKSK